MKVKKIIEFLEAAGWKHIRTKGDHRVFYKEGAKRPVVVPHGLNDDLPIGTQKSIIKQAGLNID
jgi:predicted RNA binding protein YcfA (HicA-like mRNA interferase family)